MTLIRLDDRRTVDDRRREEECQARVSPLCHFYRDAHDAIQHDDAAARWLAGELTLLKAKLEGRLGKSLSDD